MNPRNFFAELKRRNVYKVAVAYVVVAWVLIQVATQVFPFFDIPNWIVRAVILLLCLGFPVALVLAWAFDLTPEGLKRTDSDEPGPARTGGRVIHSVARSWLENPHERVHDFRRSEELSRFGASIIRKLLDEELVGPAQDI